MGNMRLVTTVLVFNLVGLVMAADPFLQEPGPRGLVVIEAENFDENVPQGAHTWEFVTDPPGFSGFGAMQSLPESEGEFILNDPADYLINSPRLDYKVRFFHAGTHYVWVRGIQTSNDNNSFHVGINGKHSETSDRGGNQFIYNEWLWNGESYNLDLEVLALEVPNPGEHIINVWMREDGFVFDKLILTKDADFVPEGLGLEQTERGLPESPGSPRPLDGNPDVPRDVVLSWLPGIYAETHDVYFGTSFTDVNEASRDDDRGVRVSQGQIETSFDVGQLPYSQTYYWRIDEVNAAPDHTIWPGPVWDFTVEPEGYPVEGARIVATASSTGSATALPENTINGSGLDNNDQHGTVQSDMWLTSAVDMERWIQYEFDRPYRLLEMWVWNQNQTTESFVGFGVRNATIEVSLDGTNWTAVPGVPEFARAPGSAAYKPNTVIDLDGAVARYLRLTINDNWGNLQLSGLSEVRFYYIPTYAREPKPADGTATPGVDVIASWRRGRGATGSDVYLGTELDSVAQVGNSNTGSLDLRVADPFLGQTYIWQVHENEGDFTWVGDPWRFTTPDWLTLDDFDQYEAQLPDDPQALFNVWVDGFGDESNSSVVGHPVLPYPEQIIVLGSQSSQSLPFFYGQGDGDIAEATRTFDPPRDWTRSGIQTLLLNFHGETLNAPGALYVKVNGVQVDYPAENATQAAMWRQWNIDLTALGTDLSNVRTLSLGILSEKSGVVYFDDLLLYREAPPVPVPTDPANNGLIAAYDMEDGAVDVSGQGRDGTPIGNPPIADGPPGLGLAMRFDGIEDHVELPIGDVIGSATDFTFGGWVNHTNQYNGLWQRIFDFGIDPNAYMFLTPANGVFGTGPMRFAMLSPTSTGESLVDAPTALRPGWHHVAVVIDSSTMTLTLYLDGTAVGSKPTEILPRDLGMTTHNWLGRSQFDADDYFSGELDEVRLYNRALSEGEIRYLVGDR